MEWVVKHRILIFLFFPYKRLHTLRAGDRYSMGTHIRRGDTGFTPQGLLTGDTYLGNSQVSLLS